MEKEDSIENRYWKQKCKREHSDRLVLLGDTKHNQAIIYWVYQENLPINDELIRVYYNLLTRTDDHLD